MIVMWTDDERQEGKQLSMRSNEYIYFAVLKFYGIEALNLNEWPSAAAESRNGSLSASLLLDASASGEIQDSSTLLLRIFVCLIHF